MFRKRLVLSSAFLLAMLGAAPALAGSGGGGAIVRMDHSPRQFVAGATVDVLYTVLWMGETPVAGASAIELYPAEGTDGPLGGIRFEAAPTKTTGQYLAKITIPSEGKWLWAATHARGWTDLGSIEVAPATIGTVLNSDVVALVLAVAATAGLALFLSRTKAQFAAGVLDHVPQVGAEGA